MFAGQHDSESVRSPPSRLILVEKILYREKIIYGLFNFVIICSCNSCLFSSDLQIVARHPLAGNAAVPSDGLTAFEPSCSRSRCP